jgi:hypothetical protein
MAHTLLKELNVTTSAGNDCITNKMLKMVADTLDTPLYRLFSKLIIKGQFPESWKLGTLVPILKKKGNINSVVNYRSVTLFNSIPKILECIIYNTISGHVIDNNLLFINQSGFLQGHDTQKQLLQIINMLKCN